MRLITTHINADFDGLAAMVAAQKIYPDAVMAFPGSQERNVREFIAQNLLYSYDFAKIKDIDLTSRRHPDPGGHPIFGKNWSFLRMFNEPGYKAPPV